jgi:hypothetical protein
MIAVQLYGFRATIALAAARALAVALTGNGAPARDVSTRRRPIRARRPTIRVSDSRRDCTTPAKRRSAWSGSLHLPKPPGFAPVSHNDPRAPEYGSTNSDLAFSGNHLFVGNYNGINFYDIDNPARSSCGLR